MNYIVIAAIIALLAAGYFLDVGGFLLVLAGWEDVIFDMKGVYTGVEVKFIMEDAQGNFKRAVDIRCSKCDTLLIHLQRGEIIDYIEWNTDQTTIATVRLYGYTVNEGVIIDKDGNKRPIPQPVCSYGEKQCSGMVLQGCSADGTAWEDIEACDYGCDTDVLMCRPAPDEPPVPPPEDSLPWLVAGVIGVIAAVVLVGWKLL